MLLVATQAWWEGFMVFFWMVFQNVALPILLTVGIVLAERWLKIKIDDKKELMLHKYAFQAADYADQKLRVALKEGEEPKDKNAFRMQKANEFLALALGSEYRGKLVEYLQGLIEAKLGRENAEE